MPVFEWEQTIARWAAGLDHAGWLHAFMLFWSHPPKFLIPLLLLATIVGFVRHLGLARAKAIGYAIVVALVAVGLSDLLVNRVLKPAIGRLRPEPFFANGACTAGDYCWGFVSSHSANTAAFVTALCLYDRRNWRWGIPLWLLVASSRIYLGAHFPLDVICGGILGAAVATGMTFVSMRALQALRARKARA